MVLYVKSLNNIAYNTIEQKQLYQYSVYITYKNK